MPRQPITLALLGFVCGSGDGESSPEPPVNWTGFDAWHAQTNRCPSTAGTR